MAITDVVCLFLFVFDWRNFNERRVGDVVNFHQDTMCFCSGFTIRPSLYIISFGRNLCGKCFDYKSEERNNV